ncbi:MAG: MBL fold metallo-hydrolase [Candidatus Bathyarchaeia archaeon]
MEVTFLGACREVGRSAFTVASGEEKVLLDYGVIMNDEVGFPAHVSPRGIELAILSHAHLDHSGLLPILYLGEGKRLYGVEPTFELSRLLIKDFINLSGYYLPYEFIELDNMLKNIVETNYGDTIELRNGSVSILNAGHIPGSVQTLLEMDGKRLLYTGDFNLVPTRLLKEADRVDGDLDAVIIESTYATEDHPPRDKLEEQFVKESAEVVEDGGFVLVPAFGVGRSQEILLALVAHGFHHPIFLDGMAVHTLRILLNHKSSLRDPDLLEKALNKVEIVRNRKERKNVLKTPSVIIAPAGMLKGGTAVFYMESLALNRKNAVFLVSYQIPGTPGSILLEKGRFNIKGKFVKVKAKVSKFDFSSHSGMSELHKFLSRINPKAKVFTVHGTEENCEQLAEWAKGEFGMDAQAPHPGKKYVI